MFFTCFFCFLSFFSLLLRTEGAFALPDWQIAIASNMALSASMGSGPAPSMMPTNPLSSLRVRLPHYNRNDDEAAGRI